MRYHPIIGYLFVRFFLFHETHNSQIDRWEKEKSIGQWDCFDKVKAMSIICAHLSPASSALLLLSSISRSLHDDDQITFFLYTSFAPTNGRAPFLFFLRSYARSFACVNGRKEGEKKIYSSTTVRYTHITHSVAKHEEKAVFFFSPLLFPFLHRVVWVDVMWCCKAPKKARHDAWCTRMQEKN